MPKLSKLFQNLLAGRTQAIRFREFQRLLEAFGFRLARIKGSHHVYGHELAERPMIVQPNGKDAKGYQVQQFLDMIEQLGLKMDD